jgi:hypothetical protein
MNSSTHLEPLNEERARELQRMIQDASDDGAALALNDQGCVVAIVPATDSQAEHLLGDFDVHA